MRMTIKSRALTVLLPCIVLTAITFCFGGELMEPSRTLKEPGKAWGGLTVFSEPPQLEVFLDGKKVGRTPLWLRDVETGLHMLKIEQAETGIQVNKDKTVRIGLFKGSFVTFSESPKETQQLEARKKEISQPSTVEKPAEQEKRKDLTLWEQFVNGSLKHF